MHFNLRILAYLLLSFPLSGWWGLNRSDAAQSEGEADDYLQRVRPVFHERCIACHGALKQEAGLRLDTAFRAVQGASSGPILTPGDGQSSSLLDRIRSTDLDQRMPPDGEPLHPDQVRSIQEWIARGASLPEHEDEEIDPRSHWAFQSPVRPATPVPTNPLWRANPIDAFIAYEQEQRGLTPQLPARNSIWLRRVSLDLIGLPPTIDEINAFENAIDPKDFQVVVDRLLATPQHAERWGRHWMDLWRYSDWWGLGAEVRNSQKHMWHWRDWILESIQEDKGYDQMILEMLAADELYPQDTSRLRATGYLARQYFKFNRTTWLDETVEHTSKAMLGMTWNCSKCHDHKYDPITQEDYYRMRAIFEPYQVRMDIVPGELDVERDGIPRAFDCNLEASTWIHIRGDDRNPDLSRPIQAGVPEFLGVIPWKVEPVPLPTEAIYPGLKPSIRESWLASATSKYRRARDQWTVLQTKLREALPDPAGVVTGVAAMDPVPLDSLRKECRLAEYELAVAHAEMLSIGPRYDADLAKSLQSTPEDLAARIRAAAAADRRVEVANAQWSQIKLQYELETAPLEKQQEFADKLKAADARVDAALKQLAAPGESYRALRGAEKTAESNLESEESRSKPFPSTSTGRRRALARWITDRRNPLTARVAVNHIWMRHFGKPLVPTIFDFGRKGTPPTHPALLDYLAVELIESGWSMKHLHRLITTSQTYRMSSSAAGAADTNLALDRDNRYYWRMNTQRMESQTVRDSILYLAGELDTQMGGPSIPSSDEGSRRRSLYFFQSHNEHQKFLSIFDDANVLECYRRAQSIVPQQALTLENSPLVQSASEKLAQRILVSNSAMEDDEFAKRSFECVLGVLPNSGETEAMIRAMAQWRASALARQASPDHIARLGLIRALFNHNDFITIR
ncbi:MAG: PSD1 and planctomycete cytochrome C domain-containing protein [Planctomycetota bacterium]